MEATFIPSSTRNGARSHGKLSFGGHLYRFQKELTAGKYRRKCARSERNFARPGYDVADGASQGPTVLRHSAHAIHCEPRAAAAEVATIRGDVIAKAGAFGGIAPLRAVALSLAKASAGATHALPESGPLKRSAQNAAYRARKKAHVHGEAGVVPNYRSPEELSIPQSATRRADGGNFLLHDSGPGGDRVLLLGTQGNIRSHAQAEVWAADGTLKVCPTLWPQVHTVHAVVGGYCLPCIYALLPDKSQGAYLRMWQEIRNLLGPEEDGRERLVTTDFGRAAINAFLDTSPQSEVAGCFFHLGQSSITR